jgi:uncharacterized protein
VITVGDVQERERISHMWQFIMRSVLLMMLGMLSLVAQQANAEGRRVALLIGNQDYRNVAQLANPHNDVTLLAGALREAGFETVETALDLDLSGMQKALRDFEDKADGAGVALIYYSGHGMEMNGVNYMIPVDAALKSDRDVEDETIALGRLERSLAGASRLKLVILDACRDNPFAATMARSVATRSLSRGLAKTEPDNPDMLVAYASRAGTVALDGDKGNSPFAIALARYLVEPGLDIRIALGKVRDAVVAMTDHQQEPFVYGSLGGAEISLNVGQLNISIGGDGAGQSAARDWENVRDVADADILKAFIAKYGSDPVYRMLAERKLADLERSAATPADVEKDAFVWEALKGSSDAAALKRFIELYPQSRFRGEAEIEIAALQPADKLGRSLTPARKDCYMAAAEAGAIAGYGGVEFGRIDPSRAMTACAQAVNESPDDGMLVDFLARTQEAGKNYDEAKRNYEKASALGNLYAMTNLGWMYVYGNGVSKDEERGRKMVEEAARAGNAFAQASLGWVYRQGLAGAQKDAGLAAKWYRQAATQGYPAAMSAMGWLYREGFGVEQNYVTSLDWYKKAATAGDSNAISSLGFAYQSGIGAARNYTEAAAWFQKGAARGDPYSMVSLAVLYDAGRGVKQDYTQARYWYEKAADAGNAVAMMGLARLYDKGLGIRIDAKAAARWAVAAVQTGNVAARASLKETPERYSLEFRKEIQAILADRGVYAGPFDGDFGAATRTAIDKLLAKS